MNQGFVLFAVVTDYLLEVNIHVLDWPSCNPDLNTIELFEISLIDEIELKMSQQLIFKIAESGNPDQGYLETFIRSIPQHCTDVIIARGGV